MDAFFFYHPIIYSPYLILNNISLVFDFSGLDEPAYELRLSYRSIGDFDNIQVNNGPLHILPLLEAPAEIAPGVIAFPVTGADSTVLTLVGQINRLLVGGQELLLDHVCVWGSYQSDYGSHCGDFSTLEVGTQFGAPAGHSPGDYVYIGGGLWDIGIGMITVENFYSEDFVPAFNVGTVVDNHPDFSATPHLQFDNISFQFWPDILLSGEAPPLRFTIKYQSLSGMDNLFIGGDYYIGKLDDIPLDYDYFPYIVISHNVSPTAHYLTIEGEFLFFGIGGQDLLLDDICLNFITPVREVPLEQYPSITLFPNPAPAGVPLLISADNPSLWGASCELFDALGRQVSPVYAIEGSLTEVPSIGLPRGLFFFRVRKDGSLIQAGKFIVQ